MNETEQKIIDRIDANRELILTFARDIYNHAELGYKEVRTAQKFAQVMRDLQLTLQEGLAITGVKAYLKKEGENPVTLALLGELDAIRLPQHPHANSKTGAAHGCGHHAQLAGVVGAALALSDPEIAEKLDGQVVFFATPAEEYGEVEYKKRLMDEGRIVYGGGKCELLRLGAFDDIHLCMAHHIMQQGIAVGTGSSNGVVSKIIRIKGKAAHAGVCPEEGINALSAATLGLQALAMNQETFRSQDYVRVHPIMTKGGELVNVVPDEAVMEALVRGRSAQAVADASKKTDRAFKAGAYAMGAGCEITTMPGYLPSLPQQMPEEVTEIIRELAGEKEVTVISPLAHGSGSTDVGDVQHMLPVMTFFTGGIAGGLHQTDFDVADEEEAYLLTAKIFALGAYRLLRNGAEVAKRVCAEYEPRFQNKEEYVEFVEQFRYVEEM